MICARTGRTLTDQRTQAVKAWPPLTRDLVDYGTLSSGGRFRRLRWRRYDRGELARAVRLFQHLHDGQQSEGLVVCLFDAQFTVKKLPAHISKLLYIIFR